MVNRWWVDVRLCYSLLEGTENIYSSKVSWDKFLARLKDGSSVQKLISTNRCIFRAYYFNFLECTQTLPCFVVFRVRDRERESYIYMQCSIHKCYMHFEQYVTYLKLMKSAVGFLLRQSTTMMALDGHNKCKPMAMKHCIRNGNKVFEGLGNDIPIER